ncbi:uncharacterized protein LOC125514112 isoform X2 [Triticum urartu]|uniref:uncharacterized protein LOC125514112 isoform X2 n=1 Tax=Triticum urartu TaxID=4572 RepID=UPI002043698C|nr:uncharacterized protein LOC125514112 isoform X2 [Triticum urartu]
MQLHLPPPPPLSSRKRGRRPRTWWCSTWCCGATWRMHGRRGAWWRRGDMPPWPPSGRTATTRTLSPTARPVTSTACTTHVRAFALLPNTSCLQFSPPNLRICIAPLIKCGNLGRLVHWILQTDAFLNTQGALMIYFKMLFELMQKRDVLPILVSLVSSCRSQEGAYMFLFLSPCLHGRPSPTRSSLPRCCRLCKCSEK